MLVVIDDKVQADSLHRILYIIDLNRAGKVSSGASAGSGKTALTDHGILRSVRKSSRTAELLLADLFALVLARYQDRIVTPPVMSGQYLLKTQVRQLILQLCTDLPGAVIADRHENTVLAVVPKQLQIFINVSCPQRHVASHAAGLITSAGFSIHIDIDITGFQIESFRPVTLVLIRLLSFRNSVLALLGIFCAAFPYFLLAGLCSIGITGFILLSYLILNIFILNISVLSIFTLRFFTLVIFLNRNSGQDISGQDACVIVLFLLIS